MSWRSAISMLLVACLLVPLIVGDSFFFPFVVPRNIYFRVLVELIAMILVVVIGLGRARLELRHEPIFWSLVAFVAACSLSALFSPARTHSFFGDFERMGGVWAWLHLVVFFLLLRTLRDADWARLLNGALAVSVVVSLGTIVEHARNVPLGRISSVVAASSSTVGNSGLLAAYLMFGLALAVFLATSADRFKIVYVVAGGVNLVALLFAENRSTIIALVLGSVVAASAFAVLSTESRRRWIAPVAALTLAVSLAATTLVMRAFPSSRFTSGLPSALQRLALTDPSGSDASRTIQWRTALEGFRDRPILGYGPENYNLAWSAHFNPSIYSLDTEIYDRAHNQFLEALATTGIVGTLAFLGIWVAIFFSLYRAYKAYQISAAGFSVLFGLQVAYASYLLFWFVDINSTMLWVLFAALIASYANSEPVIEPVSTPREQQSPLRVTFVGGTLAAFGLSLYLYGIAPLQASRALARIDTTHDFSESTVAAIDLVTTSPAPQTAHTPMVLAEYMGSLKQRFAEIERKADQRKILDSAFSLSLQTFRAEIHRDTLNDRLYTHEAALLLDAADYYGSDSYVDQAVLALEHAIALSPRRLGQRVLLANAFLFSGEKSRARAVLRDAIKVDPELGEPRYRLATLYLNSRSVDSALALLRGSLSRGYVGAPETYLAIGKRLEFSGRGKDAAALYEDYLEAKYTKAVWDAGGAIDKSVPTADVAVAAHLPLLYARARESELAVKTAAALSAFDPSQSRAVEQFVSDMGSRRRSNWLARNSLLKCVQPRGKAVLDSVAVDACAVFRRKL
ncbi:MAG: O-antigen ligase family protein [Gemmatimonadaceae bacterium]